MRRVDKYKVFDLSEKEKQILKDKKVINWCGGEWWFKFLWLMRLVRMIIEFSWKLILNKILLLFHDIRELCYIHDIRFTLWWNLKDFYKANKNFIIWILDLLYWASPVTRFFVKIVLFIWLNTIWLKYFSFWKKKNLNDLFIHNFTNTEPK